MTVAARHGPDSALRVLAELEEGWVGATGALVFGSERKISGVVLIEQRRVCWATAQGLRQRLTDMLRQYCRPSIGAEAMEKLFLHCKEQHKPIGEELVKLKLIDAAALRSVLLHHTAESLCADASWQGRPRWVEHRSRGYLSAYTYLPHELLCYASSLARGQTAVDAADLLLGEFAGERNAAVFEPLEHTLLSCRLPAGTQLRLRSLRSASRWAAESFAEHPDRSTVLKFALDGRGGTWVGWRYEGLTFLVHCPDREDFSKMLKTLNLKGWTSAVQSSVPFTDVHSPVN